MVCAGQILSSSAQQVLLEIHALQDNFDDEVSIAGSVLAVGRGLEVNAEQLSPRALRSSFPCEPGNRQVACQ